ncbi:MAG TPA: NADPH-dependent F420 reductase [Burkholderiales bacterium]|nr:NADPH-dependent F420 reductase [Burkholderiales bacterium]
MEKHHRIDCSRRDFLRVAGSGAVLLAASPLALSAGGSGGAPLKIGTIGSGHIGSTLGTLWVKTGHPVMFSSRKPEELRSLVDSLGSLARAGTVEEAIAFADVVLLAVPYRAMPQIGKDFGKALATKALVLDATNPIVARDGEIATWARGKGAGLASAELLPGARIVRAFNAIGYARLPDAQKRQGERTGMPMAGDDAKAIALASTLVREIGFEPVVVGPLAMGKHLIPGTPLAGEHTAGEIRKIVASLK